MHTIAATAAEAGSGSSVASQPRLVRAANEFEAQMMKELLKPLTSGSTLTGEDDDSSSGSGGALGEFASESLARGLSEHGGFGVANRIVRELGTRSNREIARRYRHKRGSMTKVISRYADATGKEQCSWTFEPVWTD